MGGIFALIMVVIMWAFVAAAAGAIIYFAIRFGVLHALQSHSRWVDAGKPQQTQTR